MKRRSLLQTLIKIPPLINLESMVAKSTLCVALITLIVSGTASSQPRAIDKDIPVSTWVLSSTPDSVRLCVGYSIPFNRLIFIRSDEASIGFNSTLSFSADALDSLTGVNYHGFAGREINVVSFTESQSTSNRAEDFVVLTLPRSVFHIDVEIRDDRQRITYVSATIDRRFISPDTLGIASVIFIDSISSDKYYPVMRERVAPFPKAVRFVIVAAKSARNQFATSLLDKGRRLAAKPVLTEPASERLEPVRKENGIYFSSVSDTAHTILVGKIQTDTLDEGIYDLQISGNGRTRVFPFHYVWANKPLTLRNFDIAILLLKYIVPDSIYSEIASGSSMRQKEKFDAYWKSHDPTPATAYNELEAEYYERADFANKEFRTLRSVNGALTDRGKAYILFGKPERIVREFRNDGTFEIWKYPNLKKSLVFKERNFGEFELYQTEQL